jgi:dienelactone hydrolase
VAIFRLLIYLTISVMLVACSSAPIIEGQKFDFFTKLLKRPSPSVILSHGSDCAVDYSLDLANKLNDWGFNAVILNHCSRRGIPAHTSTATYLSAWDRSDDYFLVSKWIKDQPWHAGAIAVVGWSQGGSGVLSTADYRTQKNSNRSDAEIDLIDAYVAFYPGCDIASPPIQPHKPLLILHGEADELALIGKCAYPQLNHQNYSIITYPNAGHGFDIFGPTVKMCKEPLGCFTTREYDPKATVQSRDALRAFLLKNLSH